MRTTKRSVTAVVLVVLLAVPASAARRSTSRPGGIVQAVKRFVIRAVSRISPPIGSPVVSEEPPAEEPVKTQQTS